MNTILRNALAAAGVVLATQALAQVTFYEREGFEGQTFTTNKKIANFDRLGFNDRASSLVVLNDRWEACEDIKFRGRCVVLRPGRYPTLAAMGMNNRVSSVRVLSRNARIDEDRYAPEPIPVYDNHRRYRERLYEANITSVRAVVGPPEQRCWIEHEQVAQVAPQRGEANVPGAIAGALLGGIIGHQVGGGRGKDLATVGGAVAGGALGANVGRDSGGQQATTRDVQRCKEVPSQARTEFWDVTYSFRGLEHRIQVAAPPGPTITVNERGEPRA
ncbi:MAG: beta/gamma crystallin-related protein [Sterolibacterium sp.]